MNDSVKFRDGININMAHGNGSEIVMKVAPDGNIEFPNSKDVEIAVVKVFNEDLDVIGANIVFKVRFKKPIKVGKND